MNEELSKIQKQQKDYIKEVGEEVSRLKKIERYYKFAMIKRKIKDENKLKNEN